MMRERVYIIREATKLLGVSAKTIKRWEREGKIKCYRTVGGHRVIPESEITRILGIKKEEREGGEPQPSPTTPAASPLSSTEIRLKRIEEGGRIRFVLADKDYPPP
jgi:excisionase family DNA binding protein